MIRLPRGSCGLVGRDATCERRRLSPSVVAVVSSSAVAVINDTCIACNPHRIHCPHIRFRICELRKHTSILKNIKNY
jgi:hypothetical protein